jgi:hypothetical protein
MKMCISDGVTMIQCRWKCYDLIFEFSVHDYPRIHSFLTLLSLRLAELGSLEAFHYSSNKSKEISCSLCCTFSLSLSFSPSSSLSSLSLFLSPSSLLSMCVFEYVYVPVSVVNVCVLCVDLSIVPSFPSLSVHGLYHKLAAGAKFWRSSAPLVSIPTRSVTYINSTISRVALSTSCSILYQYIHILMRAVELRATSIVPSAAGEIFRI